MSRIAQNVAAIATIAALVLAWSPTADAADASANTIWVQAAGQSMQGYATETVRDENASPQLREAAQVALERTISTDDAAWILALISDWRAPTDSRVWAARMAADQGLPGAAEALKAGADDDLYAVRAQSRRSLTQLKAVGVACLTSCAMPTSQDL